MNGCSADDPAASCSACRRLPSPPDLARTNSTRELDHILAAVFGLWDQVIPEERLFTKSPQLSLMPRGPKKAGPREAVADKKAADDEG